MSELDEFGSLLSSENEGVVDFWAKNSDPLAPGIGGGVKFAKSLAPKALRSIGGCGI